MSVATQITRLQGVRDQIRNKMVSLGLSENTDLLQNLADDLDGIEYRGDASTTLSTSARSKTLDAGYYTGGTITVPNDYFPVNSTNTTATASDVLSGKKFVNTSGNTVTGNIATVGSSDVTATVTASVSNITSINASQVTDGVTVTASASGSTVVPVGYYSTQVSKTPSDSTSTTIKPKLAGTNGAIELTAGTSAFTKTSTADYSNGFITSVKVNPTPSETKEYTPTMNGDTIRPTPNSGRLLSSVTVKGVPYFSVTLSSGGWKSDSNVAAGKYCYNVSNTSITASNNLYVIPDNASAAQSFGVYAYSQSRSSGANAGALQFRAMAQPTSDLTYTVYYLS